MVFKFIFGVALFATVICYGSCRHNAGKEATNFDSVVNESNITPAPDLGSQPPPNAAKRESGADTVKGFSDGDSTSKTRKPDREIIPKN